MAKWKKKLLSFRLGLAQTCNAIAVFPLIAFLEEFDAFEALQNVALAAHGGAGCSETAML